MGFGADIAEFMQDNGIDDVMDAIDMWNDPGPDYYDYDDDHGELDFAEHSNTARHRMRSSQVFDKRPGDWTCPGCGDHVFARNDRCRVCKTAKPRGLLEARKAVAKAAAVKRTPPSATSSSLSAFLQSVQASKRPRHAPASQSETAQSSNSVPQVQKVVLRDSKRQPSDFGTDPSTTDKVLRAMGGFHQQMADVVKKEIEVKTEPGTDDDSIVPEDSASNVGAANARIQMAKRMSAPLGNLNIGSERSAVSDSEKSVESIASLSFVSGKSGEGGGRCFLASALFKSLDGRFVEASALSCGAEVVAADGQIVQVQFVDIQAPRPQEVIELVAGADGVARAATLKVTPSHRIIVQRGQRPQTIPAGALAEGDDVFCSDQRLEKLFACSRVMETVAIVAITFSPDVPVAAYEAPPPAILSKGHGHTKKNRRSLHRARDQEDRFSVLDTEDGFS